MKIKFLKEFSHYKIGDCFVDPPDLNWAKKLIKRGIAIQCVDKPKAKKIDKKAKSVKSRVR